MISDNEIVMILLIIIKKVLMIILPTGNLLVLRYCLKNDCISLWLTEPGGSF